MHRRRHAFVPSRVRHALVIRKPLRVVRPALIDFHRFRYFAKFQPTVAWKVLVRVGLKASKRLLLALWRHRAPHKHVTRQRLRRRRRPISHHVILTSLRTLFYGSRCMMNPPTHGDTVVRRVMFNPSDARLARRRRNIEFHIRRALNQARHVHVRVAIYRGRPTFANARRRRRCDRIWREYPKTLRRFGGVILDDQPRRVNFLHRLPRARVRECRRRCIV
mmetsp:Transcript_8213/g.30459  ORF Transcript_8213/g.30459 Transcript_8213/m.30459 type:complete len:220 (+) Transcript_8213:308-967(+)